MPIDRIVKKLIFTKKSLEVNPFIPTFFSHCQMWKTLCINIHSYSALGGVISLPKHK